MAELRLHDLTAQTIAAANSLTLKPGQEAFIEPETYTAAEDKLDVLRVDNDDVLPSPHRRNNLLQSATRVAWRKQTASTGRAPTQQLTVATVTLGGANDWLISIQDEMLVLERQIQDE